MKPAETVSNPASAFLVFDTHATAKGAIRTLGQSGFDMKKLSLVGKGYHSEEKPMGLHTAGDRIKAWGGTGAFWGGIWGMVLAPAVFVLPGLGVVGMAGPLVATLVGAPEGSVVGGSQSAPGAALAQVGVPKDQIIKVEAALKVDKYVMVVHGSAEEEEQARKVLDPDKVALSA
jgi:hypothetical protein